MSKKNHLWQHGRGWSKAAKARRDGKLVLRKKILEEQITAASELIAAGVDPQEAYARFGALTKLVETAQKKGIRV